MYQVTKTYGHELGLSACFRQWKAKSHCRFLHGYPLSFKLTFSANHLDENNWVIDFGGLKEVKQWLCDTFDHKLVIAADDPNREQLEALAGGTHHAGSLIWDKPQLADPVVLPTVGCEGFAKYVFDHVNLWLIENKHNPRVCLDSVEVREHGGNSAIYAGLQIR